MINSLDLAAVNHFGVDKKSPMEARRKASFHFSRALSRGTWKRIWGKIRGQETGLAYLGLKAGAERQAGKSIVVDVAIKQIAGSEGRSGDFDRHFNPLKEHLRDRWTSIAAARRQGIALPPVELIQIGSKYYVRDGHHRISVAKALGQATIEAQIV